MPDRPANIDTVIGSGERACIGQGLRDIAWRLYDDAPIEWWRDAARLIDYANRIDARHEDKEMSQLATNIRTLIANAHAAGALIAQLEQKNAALTAQLATASALDADDVAAEAELAAEVARLEPPVDAGPANPGDVPSDGPGPLPVG